MPRRQDHAPATCGSVLRNQWLERASYLLETTVPDSFASSDARQGPVQRVASVVGHGAIAISLVHQGLETI